MQFVAKSLVPALVALALLCPTGVANAAPNEDGKASVSAERSQADTQGEEEDATIDEGKKEEQRTAVGIHEPELSAAQTVWCIGNPKRFAISARAIGLDVGERPSAREFDRPNGSPLTLEKWSQSATTLDIQDFNAACLPAYEAFSPKGTSGGGFSEEELWNVLNLVVGAGLGAGLGLGGTAFGERRQAHHQDAGSLREMADGLVDAVSAYADTKEASLEQSARNQAHVLQGAIGRWSKLSPDKSRKADEILEKLLRTQPAPNLANPSDSTQLNKWAKEVNENVQELADQVTKFFRKSQRRSGA